MAAKSPFRPAAPREEVGLGDLVRLHQLLLEPALGGGTHRLAAEILQTSIVLLGADKGILQILDPETGAVEIGAQVGVGSDLLAVRHHSGGAEGPSLCDKAVRTRTRAFTHVSATAGWAAEKGGPQFRSVQCTPLLNHDGDVTGIVSTHWRESYRPTADQWAAFDRYINGAAEVLAARLTLDREISQERSARHAAEELSRGKDRLIATLVHELRQPLGPMIAALEMMRLRISPELDERSRQLLERQVRHLMRLVEDLVDAARLNEGKTQLEIERVDLREIVQEAVSLAAVITEPRAQRVTVILPPHAVLVNVDPGRMQQIMSNLLNNASKFSDDGSDIRVQLDTEAGQARIIVEDQGRGIAGDVLPFIFDLFRQSASGEGGGLGIGLSVVRGLVELQGGSIEATSEGPGRGSTFTVRLPIATV